MAEPLLRALSRLHSEILDDEHLVRALASGRRRGQPDPRWRRIELRYVDLKAGRHLQLTAYDDTQAHVSNHADPREVLDDLLEEPFANWHVETTTHTHQLRVTKKGQALLHSSEREQQVSPARSHDQAKERLLPEDHPALLEVLLDLGHPFLAHALDPTFEGLAQALADLAALASAQSVLTKASCGPEDLVRELRKIAVNLPVAS